MEKEIEKKEKQIKKLQEEIRKTRWAKRHKEIFEEGKNDIGSYYKFHNAWSNSPERWYVWVEVTDCVFEDDNVYAVVNWYEKQFDGEITIKIGHKKIQALSWFQGWTPVRSEEFIKNKKDIVDKAIESF